MNALDWFIAAGTLGAIAAVLGVPLTAMAHYLRAMREDQRTFQAELVRRVDRVETQCERVALSVDRVEREYTTRADWLRESAQLRDQLTRLVESMTRVHSELEGSRGLATQFVRTTHAIIELTERLGQRLAGVLPARGAARDE